MAASLSSHRSAESPPVYISVLNWNKADNTIRCLESLAQLDYPNYHVLVVDRILRDSVDNRPPIESVLLKTWVICGICSAQAAQQARPAFWILNNDVVGKFSTAGGSLPADRVLWRVLLI